jgi:DNA-binding winged helix-turn-helix (wHTH) protein
MTGTSYRIGDWTFHPAANELVRPGERRRLEDRAGRTLALLCAHGGEPVAQETIVAEIWNGRSQSPNSLPVVIGQLRRALGDEARNPRFIETVPKRGYRLIADDPSPARIQAKTVPVRRGPVALAASFLVAVAIAGALLILRPASPALALNDVVNATGDPAYDPLARATSELIAAELSRRDIAFRRGRAAGVGDEKRLEAKLVLWSGEPTVSLAVADEGGAVAWSAMARGPADAIPRNVARAIEDYSNQPLATD